MSKTTILLVSPSVQFKKTVKHLLQENWPEEYDFICIDKISNEIPTSNICLLDENALPENSIDYLAQSSYQLAPRPLIYIMNEEPENSSEFKTVKSLTSDFLVKNRMSASGLHNTIRYTLETADLKLELEQQQKRYTSLFYNAVEPAFFLDKSLVITGVNDSFLKTFELTLSEVINKKFDTFLATKSAIEDLNTKLKEKTTGAIDDKLHFVKSKNSTEFLGHLRVSPISESILENGEIVNRLIAYHGTLRNISHFERLRDVKEKSEKIAMTYRLARTMAHEIRNPLTNVNLAVDQLKEETKENGDLDLYYGIIERCTKRIDGILGQLLSSSEKQIFKKETFDIITLFQSVIDTMKDRSRLEGVKIFKTFHVESVLFEGDKEKFKIAFTNLFANAIESMDKAENRIDCGTYIDANYLCIYVRDNGSGMDEKQRELLFDPFYTSKKNGVGLGLTSTQTIISEHNGQIEVQSKKGIGSNFTIYLPLDKS